MVKEKMTKIFFSLRIFSRLRFLKHFWWNSFDLNQKVKLNLLTLLLGTSLKIVFYLWTCDLSLHNSFILIFKWKQFTSQARIIFQTRSFIFKKDTFYKIYCKYYHKKNEIQHYGQRLSHLSENGSQTIQNTSYCIHDNHERNHDGRQYFKNTFSSIIWKQTACLDLVFKRR